MTADWKKAVLSAPGKLVKGEAIHMHVSALPHAPAILQEVAARAVAGARIPSSKVQMLTFFVREPYVVSIKSYPRFMEDMFPATGQSWKVNTQTGQYSEQDFSKRANRPILHRKETMLHPSHPRHAEFAAATREAERLGLFYDMPAMGTELKWAERLKKHGVRVVGNRVVAARANPAVEPSHGYSPDTSLDQVPKLHTLGVERGWWKRGSINADIGGGRFDTATRYLHDVAGVRSYVYDKQLPDSARVLSILQDGGADTATIANVLNVIPAPNVRQQVLRLAQNIVKPGGLVTILTWEGKTGSGEGYVSKWKIDKTGKKVMDSWQENRVADTYLPEVRRVFPNAIKLYGMIVATNTSSREFPQQMLLHLQHPTDARARAASKAWLDQYKASKR